MHAPLSPLTLHAVAGEEKLEATGSSTGLPTEPTPSPSCNTLIGRASTALTTHSARHTTSTKERMMGTTPSTHGTARDSMSDGPPVSACGTESRAGTVVPSRGPSPPTPAVYPACPLCLCVRARCCACLSRVSCPLSAPAREGNRPHRAALRRAAQVGPKKHVLRQETSRESAAEQQSNGAATRQAHARREGRRWCRCVAFVCASCHRLRGLSLRAGEWTDGARQQSGGAPSTRTGGTETIDGHAPCDSPFPPIGASLRCSAALTFAHSVPLPLLFFRRLDTAFTRPSCPHLPLPPPPLAQHPPQPHPRLDSSRRMLVCRV
jgi:hypothetical protein